MTNEAVASMTKAALDYAILHHVNYTDLNTIKIVGAFVDGYLAGCHGRMSMAQMSNSTEEVIKGIKNACK